jgi:sigma-B regulation protein RsbU (phosphoserine phosphatase)
MLGDVSSHGFSAALVMAMVLSAAGIHAGEAASPQDALRLLMDSVGGELEETEMYLTIFYGVADPRRALLRYANAGHPHAFRLDTDGASTRLAATSAPLGLAPDGEIAGAEVPWIAGEDTLILCSDGVTDALNDAGERFGEERVIETVQAHRREGGAVTVEAVLAALESYQKGPRDDRTMLVLNA